MTETVKVYKPAGLPTIVAAGTFKVALRKPTAPVIGELIVFPRESTIFSVVKSALVLIVTLPVTLKLNVDAVVVVGE